MVTILISENLSDIVGPAVKSVPQFDTTGMGDAIAEMNNLFEVSGVTDVISSATSVVSEYEDRLSGIEIMPSL